jgi:molecular chaperone DnaK
MRITIDYGIDLGTTNSAIARHEGIEPKLLSTAEGETTMPSVVHIKADGTILTGKAAWKYVDSDPENTVIEFKRLMGSSEAIGFPASGKALLPEDLSAFVLQALLERARDQEAIALKGAVITIPAMFQLPQSEATRRAAKLVGIEYAPLLQEPIAAAIAHSAVTEKREGYWIIYDLGGGTFDVSIVRSKEGRLQVIDHDGDNHLGGKDFDRIVAQEAVQMLRKQWQFDGFKRSDPRFAHAFARLKIEAERVRIYLSEHEEALFQVRDIFTTPEGEQVDFEMSINRSKLEELIRPTILRSTNFCKEILARNRLSASSLNGLVMVGGPTLTPCLPIILQDELQVESKHYMNPMNIVAFGAALFASTQKLPKQFRPSAPDRDRKIELQLEFESMTTNPAPLLAGTIERHPSIHVAAIRVLRQDGAFDTGKLPLELLNAFMIDLALKENNLNLFSIELYDAANQQLPCHPSEITIVHGMSVASPPLSQSVGVMLADNSVAWYLRKGIVLPAQHTTTHAITVSLKRGQSGEAVNIPVIQGESNRADRNKVVGLLRIYAEKISLDLPAGNEVEITLAVDEFSHTTARAYVPLLEQWFDDVVSLDMEAKQPEEVRAALTTHMGRLSALDELAEKLSQEEKQEVDERVKDIEKLIEEGDRDSIDLADQMVRWMARKIDVAEDQDQSNIIRTEFTKLVDESKQFIHQSGSKEEQRELGALEKEFIDAIAKDDTKVALQKKERVGELVMRVYSRSPQFWVDVFYHVAQQIHNTNSGGENAKILINAGNLALQKGHFNELYQISLDLMNMLPPAEKEKITSQIM